MDAVIVPSTFQDFVERSPVESGAFDDIPKECLCVVLGRPENVCPRCGKVLGPSSREWVADTSFGYLKEECQVRVYECLRCREHTLLHARTFPNGYPLTFYYRQRADSAEIDVVLVVPRPSHMLWLNSHGKRDRQDREA